MRPITAHQINGVNRSILVTAEDSQGHRYAVTWPGGTVRLAFQRGKASQGRNGITIESLVALCIDAIERRTGHHPHQERLAATHLRAALVHLSRVHQPRPPAACP